jgi:predicted glycoside hydrolase/deacetylase ChbG (UPF0249 family)
LIRLIINADDFGWSPDVNEGIVEAHRNGILTATTIMAGCKSFDHAVSLAKETPSLDIGVHLTLLQMPSAITGEWLPIDIPTLLGTILKGQIDIYGELSAQVRKVIDAGIAPTHLDTHKHTHILPPVADALARIVRDFGIRWVRKPFDFELAGGLIARLMRTRRTELQRTLVEAGALSTDHFAGFALTGHLNEHKLLKLIERLPEGTTELMCHPGFCRDELRRTNTRLMDSREIELNALTSAKVREALTARGIELANYRS